MAKPTDRELVYLALQDAIDWQVSLADSFKGFDDEKEKEALNRVSQYRAVMKKRYGDDRTALESLGDGCKSVSIFDMMNEDYNSED